MFPARLQSKENQFQIGQSLIEIIATIAVGTILILALVALSVRSNSSSDFSKAQNQASRLASEGLEIINSLRAQTPTPGTIVYASSGSCNSGLATLITWEEFFTNDISPETCDNLGRAGHLRSSSPSCSAGLDWCLQFDTGGAATVQYEGRTFTRTVYVADTPILDGGKSSCNVQQILPDPPDFDKIKQFTVVVSWSDSSGSHNSTTTSCIQK